MRDLAPLIKLKRHQLDDKRRILGDLQMLYDQLQTEIDSISSHIAAEQAFLRETDKTVAQLDYARFGRAARQRQQQIYQSQQQVAQQIELAREALEIAFREVKTIELAQEERLRQIEAKRARAEAEALDAIGIDQFRRRS